MILAFLHDHAHHGGSNGSVGGVLVVTGALGMIVAAVLARRDR